MKWEPQEHNRLRFWGRIPELGDRVLKVVTLEDKVTIHNAFPDRGVQAMMLKYYPDTDSLHIELSGKPSAESREVSEGIVLDHDAQGNLIGIDIDNASKKCQLNEVTLSKLPSEVRTVAV